MKSEIKNVLIIGDSYSTFTGANPAGYAVYYSDADTEKNGRAPRVRDLVVSLKRKNGHPHSAKQ